MNMISAPVRVREVAESDLCVPRLPKRSDLLFIVLTGY